MKSRKSIRIADKLKDVQPLNVPGPGVFLHQYSLMSSLNMIMILGHMVVADIQLEKN